MPPFESNDLDMVMKSSPGRMGCMSLVTEVPEGLWFLVFDRATLPEPGESPLISWHVPFGDSIKVNPWHIYFGTGIAGGWSIRSDTYTPPIPPEYSGYEACWVYCDQFSHYASEVGPPDVAPDVVIPKPIDVFDILLED